MEMIRNMAQQVFALAKLAEPIMPETAVKIMKAVKANKKPENLFLRKE